MFGFIIVAIINTLFNILLRILKTKFTPCLFGIGTWSYPIRTELLNKMYFSLFADSLGISVGASLPVYVESHAHIGYHSIYLTASNSQSDREEDGRF